VRLDCLDNQDLQKLSLFNSYGFVNCVTESTYFAGGLLDGVARRRDLLSSLVTRYDPSLSSPS